MGDSENVVYLEDLMRPTASDASTSKEDANGDVQATVTTTVEKPVAAQDQIVAEHAAKNNKPAASAGSKRQRTLMDMFGGAPSTSQSKKKAKLENVEAGPSSTPDGSTSSTGLQSLNSVAFSLSTYQAELSDEERDFLALECETMGKSWLKILKDEIRKPYFIKLKRYLWEQGVKAPNNSAKSLKIYPSPQNIYAWSNLTPLGRVKVVIIGQDPYHGPGQAHGLSFSVPQGITIPPSLRNIYKEIKAEFPEFEVPKHGNLTSWAENGVLLLNTCLTVKAGSAGSHSNQGWEQFTDKVVNVVDTYGGANLSDSTGGRGRGIVFLAWGAWAAKRVAGLDKKKHLILRSAHPSPLSARHGFFGNDHFKKANVWLEEKYGPDARVNWCDL